MNEILIYNNMKKRIIFAGAVLAVITGCNMKNPFLTESSAPFGAPEFDKIKNEHYLPAFEAGIAEGKAEVRLSIRWLASSITLWRLIPTTRCRKSQRRCLLC